MSGSGGGRGASHNCWGGWGREPGQREGPAPPEIPAGLQARPPERPLHEAGLTSSLPCPSPASTASCRTLKLSGSQVKATLRPQGHLAMPGHVCDCGDTLKKILFIYLEREGARGEGRSSRGEAEGDLPMSVSPPRPSPLSSSCPLSLRSAQGLRCQLPADTSQMCTCYLHVSPWVADSGFSPSPAFSASPLPQLGDI